MFNEFSFSINMSTISSYLTSSCIILSLAPSSNFNPLIIGTHAPYSVYPVGSEEHINYVNNGTLKIKNGKLSSP